MLRHILKSQIKGLTHCIYVESSLALQMEQSYIRINPYRENFLYLHKQLSCFNKLKLCVPKGAFMYPFYIENGATARKKLQEKNVYITALWPDMFDLCDEKKLEYDMAKNILSLPVEQRYDRKDLNEVVAIIF